MTADAPAPVRRKRPWLAFAPAAVFVALAALFFVRLYAGDASRLPSALIGRPVPAFSLPPVEGLGGRPGLTDADLRDGTVTVVNVFASWCVPCRDEHPVLMELARDVRLVGIAYKDDPENTRRFLNEGGDPFSRIGADRSGRTGIDWGVYGVPETFLIGRDGKIAYKLVGPITAENLTKQLGPEIDKALAKN